MEVINYIFYRLYKHYKKDNTVYTAAMYITMFEIMMIYFIYMMYNAVICPTKNPFKEFLVNYNINQSEGKLFTVIFCVILGVANYLYYRNRVKGYETRFANHPMNKWFKLWMLYFIGLFLFFFPIMIFMLRK